MATLVRMIPGRSIGKVALAISLLAATAAAAGAQEPEPRIAFTRPATDHGHLGDLWLLEPGRAVRRLTATGKDGLAAWSPDGRRLAFFARRGESRGELWVARADGGDVRRLAEQVAPSRPAWSPDGRRILFVAWIHGDPSEIYTIGADGTGLARISHRTGRSPAWSPDGGRVAYMAFGGDGASEHDGLFVVDADGSKPKKLADSPARDSTPAWSPDGREIAFQWYESLPDHVRGEVRVVAATGGEARRITPADRSCWGGVLSPDGAWVAFVAKRRAGDELCLVKPDGTGLRSIAEAAGIDEESVAFSPDGGRLLFVGGGDLRVVGADGRAERVLASGVQPAWTFAAGARPPRPRARDLGVPFDGAPGSLNAITDVAGVAVGHATLIEGENVRTGVTCVLPRGIDGTVEDSVFAGFFALNGNGEMTGTAWVKESGFLEGPVLLTNTHSVGVARDAAIAWRVRRAPADALGYYWSLPVVAETWDGDLNDINGFHVKERHVFEAIEGARAGAPVAEGDVGAGTGTSAFGWKAGIGTASRRLAADDGAYTVGALVQANCGRLDQLTIAGVPVGRELAGERKGKREGGSIVVVIATDAPLLPHQLERLARRGALGLARTGATSGDGSGDLFIAFSTANPGVWGAEAAATLRALPNARLDPVLDATVQATEEAIINALVAAETLTGMGGRTVEALPHDRLRAVLKRYGRLVE